MFSLHSYWPLVIVKSVQYSFHEEKVTLYFLFLQIRSYPGAYHQWRHVRIFVFLRMYLRQRAYESVSIPLLLPSACVGRYASLNIFFWTKQLGKNGLPKNSVSRKFLRAKANWQCGFRLCSNIMLPSTLKGKLKKSLVYKYSTDVFSISSYILQCEWHHDFLSREVHFFLSSSRDRDFVKTRNNNECKVIFNFENENRLTKKNHKIYW